MAKTITVELTEKEVGVLKAALLNTSTNTGWHRGGSVRERRFAWYDGMELYLKLGDDADSRTLGVTLAGIRRMRREAKKEYAEGMA